jgi:transposase
MSCNLRKQTLDALRSDAEGNIAKARVNVEVYLHNPVGIGEHPDILGAIQEQLDIIAHEEERIEVLDKHFKDHHDVIG